MARVLILGYGNTLRGDDGIGVRAAQGVPPVTGAVVKTTHQLTPELAPEVAASDLVLFLDASREGNPGDIRSRPVGPGGDESRLTHQFTPERLLALARSLYGGRAKGVEITMCGERFDLSEGLSPRVAEALPRMVEVVVKAARA